MAVLRASDPQAGDEFGRSVSVSGDTVVVGAYFEDGGAGDPLDNSGAAYVFGRNQGGADNWGEVAVLRAGDPQSGDLFGCSVSISGDTAVVGAYSEGGTGDPLDNSGAAYVFGRNQGGADNWGEVAILRTSDAQAYDSFGRSVSVSGDTVVVGADWEDGGTGDPLDKSGAAYVFGRNQGGADNWGEVAVLRAGDPQMGDYFGFSVSISGDTVVVGAYSEDGGTGDPLPASGAAYVFERNQGGTDNWGEVAVLRASDAQMGDHFGFSVSISGHTVGVGAEREDGGAGDPSSRAGAAYVFERDQGGADNWGQVTLLRASDAQMGHYFGESISVSGDTVVVGRTGAAYTFVQASSDLEIVKSVAPFSVAPGETITCTLVFTNAGSAMASGVVITDVIPSSVTVSSAISSGVAITVTGATPGYVWEVQDLAPGEGGAITITAVVSAQIAGGTTFTNTASIATASIDSEAQNNSSTAQVTASDTARCGLVAGETYAFNQTSIPITISIATLGDLVCISVVRTDSDHPHAGTPQQTGRYWTIAPTLWGSNGFSLTLTLPHTETANAKDEVCRYTGTVWDCAAYGYSGVNITRTGVMTLSDWTTGDGSNPTAVTITTFSATPAGDGVLVMWETALELYPHTYYVLRGEQETGPYLRISPPISRPSDALGSGYVYLDWEVTPGGRYFYKLEVIDRDGNIAFYGPVVVVLAVDGSDYRVFLPIVIEVR